MAEVLFDMRDVRSSPEEALANERLPRRGLATRMGITCTLGYVGPAPTTISAAGDGVSVLLQPPDDEWWFLRSFYAFLQDEGSAPAARADVSLFRHEPEYRYTKDTKRWVETNAPTALEPFLPPPLASGRWIQISTARDLLVGESFEWRENSELFERQVYSGEVLLLRYAVTAVPAGNLYILPQLRLRVVRYPVPLAVKKWMRRYYPKITRSDVAGLFLGATPDAERD